MRSRTFRLTYGSLTAYYLDMQHAAEQLRVWQDRKGINQREAARELGVHYTTYNQFLVRRRLPGRQLAVRIYDLTGIPVHAWTPTLVSKKKKRLSARGRTQQCLQGANAV